MKKILALTLVLVFVLSLAACKKEPTVDTPELPTPSYEIKKHTEDFTFAGKQHGDITLLYIELNGLDHANRLLLDIAKARCNAALPNLSSYDTDAMPYVTYEITSVVITYLSGSFLSAKVDGTLTVSLAPHPEPFVYTINVDLKSNEELKSDQIVRDFNSIKKLFTEGKFECAYGDEKLISQTNPEDMIMQYHSEYEIYPYFYFTKDRFFMNIDLVYALGSDAGYSIPLSEVKKHLNTDNEEISKILK